MAVVVVVVVARDWGWGSAIIEFYHHLVAFFTRN
jgi:hypothetical protein